MQRLCSKKTHVISTALAGIVVWYGMNQWLQNFAFRIQIAWWVYLLAGLLTLLVTLLTVSWQSMRVTRSNPADHLRME